METSKRKTIISQLRAIKSRSKEKLLNDAADLIEQGIDPSDDEFGTILNCAVRYACGRMSYMPGLVIGFITPLIPELSGRTLWCFDQDLTNAKHECGYGDPKIDEPAWLDFHAKVRAERTKRGDELYKDWRDAE